MHPEIGQDIFKTMDLGDKLTLTERPVLFTQMYQVPVQVKH